MRPRVPARTVVVPLESREQIIRDPDVVAEWVHVAADNVDDALLDAVHFKVDSTDRANSNLAGSRIRAQASTLIVRSRTLNSFAESAPLSDFARAILASFVETAFA